MKKAVIVLPTYNEKENIRILIPEIFLVTHNILNWDVSILVVDDGSPDGTADEVRILQKKYKNLYLTTGKKQGLGNAYQRAFKYALENLKPDYIFEMDADRQHNPNLIPQFLKKIDEGADFVIGSRYIKGGGIPENWALYRKFFSYFGNWVLRFGFMKLRITDWTSGYRAINADFIEKTLPSYKKLNGYTFQVGILDRAIKNHLTIAEVPFYFEERGVGESKIKTLEFVINNCLYILFNSSFVKFTIVGLTGAVVDFGISFILIENQHVAIWIATAVSSELSIIGNFLLNNSWSFAHKKVEGSSGGIVKAFVGFNTVSFGNIFMQTLLMHFATEFFPVKYWYIYKVIIIGCIVVPYSYFMYNRFIWKNKQSSLANNTKKA